MYTVIQYCSVPKQCHYNQIYKIKNLKYVFKLFFDKKNKDKIDIGAKQLRQTGRRRGSVIKKDTNKKRHITIKKKKKQREIGSEKDEV